MTETPSHYFINERNPKVRNFIKAISYESFFANGETHLKTTLISEY